MPALANIPSANTRLTRSRARATPTKGATPEAQALPSPASAKLSPPQQQEQQPPATPNVSPFAPNAPPPTPNSPVEEEASEQQRLMSSLHSALASVAESRPIDSPAQGTNLRGELIKALEDLAVDPVPALPADQAQAVAEPTLAASPAAMATDIDTLLPAEPTTMDEDEAQWDHESEEDGRDESEEGTEGDMGDHHQHMDMAPHMRMQGLLPAGSINAFAAPEGPGHVIFEAPMEESTFASVDMSRAHGIFPSGALSANTFSATHVRFNDE